MFYGGQPVSRWSSGSYGDSQASRQNGVAAVDAHAQVGGRDPRLGICVDAEASRPAAADGSVRLQMDRDNMHRRTNLRLWTYTSTSACGESAAVAGLL